MEPLVVSATEAAKLLRISPGETLARLKRGEIPAVRDGKDWKVPTRLLVTYIENKAIAEAQGRREIYEMESKKV